MAGHSNLLRTLVITGQPVENPDPSPKQIKENILTSVKLTDKDGKPFNDTDNRPNPDSAANIDFTWEVLESLKVKREITIFSNYRNILSSTTPLHSL